MVCRNNMSALLTGRQRGAGGRGGGGGAYSLPVVFIITIIVILTSALLRSRQAILTCLFRDTAITRPPYGGACWCVGIITKSILVRYPNTAADSLCCFCRCSPSWRAFVPSRADADGGEHGVHAGPRLERCGRGSGAQPGPPNRTGMCVLRTDQSRNRPTNWLTDRPTG